MSYQCTVCVGTTNFDKLIEALDCEQFYKLLTEAGFTRLIMQIGQATYEPKFLATDDKLEVLVRKTVMLEPIINKSHLVISHCGAGIVLECLRSTMNADKEKLSLGEGTMNISVVNDSLMNNHQFELADKLN